MDESTPDTQPEGALTPPPRVPPTALATAELPPRPRRSVTTSSRWDLGRALSGVFDRLDTFGDRIASAVGLR